ncbi:hypothetical protein QZH41_002387 [Actinostola sp. cb2023]|nr:hypothetical protein QZH41_002387 [Actinostola sp. cb2023]
MTLVPARVSYVVICKCYDDMQAGMKARWIKSILYQRIPKGRLIMDGNWHHLAVTWTNSDGVFNVYVDGSLKYGSDAIHKGATIDSTKGGLVLGQDQDAYLGRYNANQSFQGNLTSVNMWDRVLTSDDILKLAKRCPSGSGEGNLVRWADLVPRKSDSVKYYCGVSCHP